MEEARFNIHSHTSKEATSIDKIDDNTIDINKCKSIDTCTYTSIDPHLPSIFEVQTQYESEYDDLILDKLCTFRKQRDEKNGKSRQHHEERSQPSIDRHNATSIDSDSIESMDSWENDYYDPKDTVNAAIPKRHYGPFNATQDDDYRT
ncbi:hypothetical protein Rs2_28557 [Raphanus sativus]|nr:hypothetical protein Rs2_28557 [Raphanus sativus]